MLNIVLGYNNPFFFLGLFIYYTCLIVCLCVLYRISGFLDEKGILVVLGLREFWSFDEVGVF